MGNELGRRGPMYAISVSLLCPQAVAHLRAPKICDNAMSLAAYFARNSPSLWLVGKERIPFTDQRETFRDGQRSLVPWLDPRRFFDCL